jgi:hypothetical protein
MEVPARARRRVSVIALSPEKTKLLVIQGEDNLWHIPDSHLHWPIGKRKKLPQSLAAHLLKDATMSILADNLTIKKHICNHSKRSKLPTGGFVYLVQSTIEMNITQAVECTQRVRKHLKINSPRVEMHLLSNVRASTSHSKYGSSTIEAVRSGCVDENSFPLIISPLL